MIAAALGNSRFILVHHDSCCDPVPAVRSIPSVVARNAFGANYQDYMVVWFEIICIYESYTSERLCNGPLRRMGLLRHGGRDKVCKCIVILLATSSPEHHALQHLWV